MIVKAIIGILSNTEAVTDLVGDRINPNIIKEGSSYPAIYVSSDRMTKINCRNDNGTRNGIIEVGVYGDTYASVRNIIEAIRNVLDDFDGVSNNVSICIMRGVDTGDRFDDIAKKHVKIIEYDALAKVLQ